LIFGEGLNEDAFLRHLRSLYSYNSNVAVTIRKGRGGTADGIVIDASNIPGDFDRRVVVLDNDKGQREMNNARSEAKHRGIILVENTPCLEALLLAILNDGKTYSAKVSSWCKSEFESNFLTKKKRAEMDEYVKLFPKTVLDKQRLKIPGLNSLILLMETTAA
jgi:hypothetical protein